MAIYLLTILVYNCLAFVVCAAPGQLAREEYEGMPREAACLRIQTDLRMHLARRAYREWHYSAICIQTGMRGMAARKELHCRRLTRAAIMIQVRQNYIHH